jgi:exonuclease SbcC
VKPLRLEMRAFGPFRGLEVVDFGKLPSSLFLIAGPIGAGKTTILDAICFALYGKSSGEGREAGDLRSHHADPSEETEVTLDFSVGGATYRVNRQPIQEIKKKRGDGNRLVQARATLWDRSGVGPADEGALLASKVRDVDERIREILGFDAAQFRQVILLPQGKFREFLSSNSKDREAILKVLFDVRRCEDLERRLKDAVQDLEQRQRSREAARREKLGEFSSRDELRLGVGAKEDEVAAVEVRHKGLTASAAKAEEAVREGRRIDALFAELAKAEKAHADLQAQSGDMDVQRERLALAEKAQPVLPDIAALDTLHGEIRDMERQLGEKERERAGLVADAEQTERQLQQHRAGEARHEQNIAEASRLEALRPKVGELEQAVQARANGERGRDRLADEVAAADVAHKDLERRAGAIESELPALRVSANERGVLDARVQELQKVEKDLGQLAQGQGELKTWTGKLALAREAQEAAEAARVGAERDTQELRARWMRSRAGALAGQLVAGEPCPVCGSPDHPAPVKPTEEIISGEELQAAEGSREAAAEREKDAARRVAAAAVKVAEIEARLDALRQALGEHAGTDAAEVHRLLGEASAARDAARTAAERVARFDADLLGLKERVKAAAESVKALSESFQQAAVAAASAAAAVNHLESVVPPDLRTAAAVEERIGETSRAVTAYRKTLQHLEAEKARIAGGLSLCEGFVTATRAELEAKRQRSEHAAAALGRKLEAAGFTDAAACRKASLDDAAMADIKEALERFNNTLQQARGAMDDARKKVAGLTRTDLAPLEHHHAEVTRELKACGVESGRLQEQCRTLAGRLKGLDDLEKEEAEAGLRSEALREIAAAAAGDNGLRMRFSTYALAAYFDDVMTHTNRRLAVMSSGRYTLSRATETSGHGFKGLDLEVHDAHTDRSRPADTLSGGEGFLASLALALGLADSVQSAAGGYKLESVFIDEGFGSLDAESLELSQRCITDLQKTGRLVGLISHVEEMSSWTPARIVITKTPRGSTIQP